MWLLVQVNKDKKNEVERLQAERAATKLSLTSTETRAEQLARELADAKSKHRSTLEDLQAAKADSALVADIQKRISKAPAGFAEGSTALAQVCSPVHDYMPVWIQRLSSLLAAIT
jgi:chromosome segregation ATPase